MELHFSCSPVDMLSSSEIISENLINNLDLFTNKRSDFTFENFTQLKTNVQNTSLQYLGVDSAKKLRDATAIVTSIQKPALAALSSFKQQIDNDFKNDVPCHDEILTNLGFYKYFTDARKNNSQSALIGLLAQFKLNMTDDMKAIITAKGMMPAAIEKIKGYYEPFKAADITQETFKGTRKEITDAAAKAYNAVYDEVIKYCKNAVALLKDNPEKKELFTFSKVLKNLSANKSSGDDDANKSSNPPTPNP